MARQTGPVLFSGTIGPFTGYQVEGVHYVKKRNSAPSKRKFQSARCYANTRRNAEWFSQAQKLAGSLYRQLPQEQRSQRKVWYPLRNRAQELVREGKTVTEIVQELKEHFLPKLLQKAFPPAPPVRKTPSNNEAISEKLIPEEEVLELGRHYGRMDPELAEQLSAASLVIKKLLSKENEEELLGGVKKAGLRQTRRLRR